MSDFFDLNMAMIRATFKLEQKQDDGTGTVGTGWLVRLPQAVDAQGPARIALVTASHVLDRMAKPEAFIHWRREDAQGKWHREPLSLAIRDTKNQPLWLRHPSRDIAVMFVEPPEHVRGHAIAFDRLADDATLEGFQIQPGDEMYALGYPRGLSANELGFPILRAGRVASYPLWPSADHPTFLMDFAVFAGNSGGPVYISDRSRKRVGATDFHEAQFVAGMLAQQVVLTDERLEIGVVLHTSFVREALTSLQNASG